jgi:hypothetical protein
MVGCCLFTRRMQRKGMFIQPRGNIPYTTCVYLVLLAAHNRYEHYVNMYTFYVSTITKGSNLHMTP